MSEPKCSKCGRVFMSGESTGFTFNVVGRDNERVCTPNCEAHKERVARSVTITREDLARAWDLHMPRSLAFNGDKYNVFDCVCKALGLDEETKPSTEFLWEHTVKLFHDTIVWQSMPYWMTHEEVAKHLGTNFEYRISSLCPEGRVRT